MPKELIHIDDRRSQLHCDNPECGHDLDEGAVAWGPHLIGYPCPRCGDSMLTRADFESSERMHRAVLWINKWFSWLGSEYDPADPSWDAEVTVRTHEAKTKIEIKKRSV